MDRGAWRATVHGVTKSRSDKTEPLSTAQHSTAPDTKLCSWNIIVILHYSYKDGGKREQEEGRRGGDGEQEEEEEERKKKRDGRQEERNREKETLYDSVFTLETHTHRQLFSEIRMIQVC